VIFRGGSPTSTFPLGGFTNRIGWAMGVEYSWLSLIRYHRIVDIARKKTKMVRR
jgi:hypothetical protein